MKNNLILDIEILKRSPRYAQTPNDRFSKKVRNC